MKGLATRSAGFSCSFRLLKTPQQQPQQAQIKIGSFELDGCSTNPTCSANLRMPRASSFEISRPRPIRTVCLAPSSKDKQVSNGLPQSSPLIWWPCRQIQLRTAKLL